MQYLNSTQTILVAITVTMYTGGSFTLKFDLELQKGKANVNRQ